MTQPGLAFFQRISSGPKHKSSSTPPPVLLPGPSSAQPPPPAQSCLADPRAPLFQSSVTISRPPASFLDTSTCKPSTCKSHLTTCRTYSPSAPIDGLNDHTSARVPQRFASASSGYPSAYLAFNNTYRHPAQSRRPEQWHPLLRQICLCSRGSSNSRRPCSVCFPNPGNLEAKCADTFFSFQLAGSRGMFDLLYCSPDRRIPPASVPMTPCLVADSERPRTRLTSFS